MDRTPVPSRWLLVEQPLEDLDEELLLAPEDTLETEKIRRRCAQPIASKQGEAPEPGEIPIGGKMAFAISCQISLQTLQKQEIV